MRKQDEQFQSQNDITPSKGSTEERSMPQTHCVRKNNNHINEDNLVKE